MALLTVEQLKHAVPDKLKKGISQDLLDQINTTLADPEMYGIYRDNFLSYAHVMRDGRFKMADFLFAIKYATHKIMGASNLDAFVRTFPDKYQDWLSKGISSKDIASYITSYNKNKLVNLILEQSLIPSWVLNQDLYQKALNTQADLMMTAASEKVRSDAANSLLTHLRPPEVQKVELNIGAKEHSSLDALRQATMEMVEQQKKMIASGMKTVKEVAEQRIIGEVIEHE